MGSCDSCKTRLRIIYRTACQVRVAQENGNCLFCSSSARCLIFRMKLFGSLVTQFKTSLKCFSSCIFPQCTYFFDYIFSMLESRASRSVFQGAFSFAAIDAKTRGCIFDGRLKKCLLEKLAMYTNAFIHAIFWRVMITNRRGQKLFPWQS